MANETATGYRNAAGTAGDEAPHGRLIGSLAEQLTSRTSCRLTPMEPDPLPDPTWDPVMQASWESFPASDAPGWR